MTDTRSLFVVGDDAQSIYGFRGSKVELILGFNKVFPNANEIILNQNYRSNQAILDLAEKILTLNPNQKRKDLFTDNPENNQVFFYLARSDKDEAEYIIRALKKQYVEEDKAVLHDEQDDEIRLDESDSQIVIEKSPVSSMFDFYLSGATTKFDPKSWSIQKTDWTKVDELNDCAVLYRTHGQSRSLEEVFLKSGLPYKLVSGTKFLDRKEIKDVLAVLKYISNASDTISLSRFLPLIMKGVGPKTLTKILDYLQNNEAEIKDDLKRRVEVLQNMFISSLTVETSLIEFTKNLLEKIGYFSYLRSEYPQKEMHLARLENVGELYSLMLKFEIDGFDVTTRLNNFLAEISLMTNQDNSTDIDTPKISLMSLHQSKGLEYETVFLVGVEDGILPHNNSLMEPDGISEEVRLAYVGVTRAKKYLHVISAESRITFGQIQANPISRIIRPFIQSHMKKVN
jgi:DNA helicase II / ATP-dependent DNA helicase PcrA